MLSRKIPRPPKPPRGYGTNKLFLQPPRSYHVPGGPIAAHLGPTTLKVLAEIERGGDDDFNAGR